MKGYQKLSHHILINFAPKIYECYAKNKGTGLAYLFMFTVLNLKDIDIKLRDRLQIPRLLVMRFK